MAKIHNDQDFGWKSKIKDAVLKPYTEVEKESLKTEFTAENNPSKDGCMINCSGIIYLWSHILHDWVNSAGVADGLGQKDIEYTDDRILRINMPDGSYKLVYRNAEYQITRVDRVFPDRIVRKDITRLDGNIVAVNKYIA